MSQTLTVSTNLIIKKVGYKIEYYILQIFLLVAILLFMIAINSNHYGKQRSKQKATAILTIQKWIKIMN